MMPVEPVGREEVALSIRSLLTWRHVCERLSLSFSSRALSFARALRAGAALLARGLQGSVAGRRLALLRAVAPLLELQPGAAEERRPLCIEVILNGRSRSIPFDTGAARWCAELRDASRIAPLGFDARLEVMTIPAARILMAGCSDPLRACRRIAASAADLLQLGMDAVAFQSVPVGCIPGLQLRDRGAGSVEALLYASDPSKEGRSVLAEVVRGMARPLERLAECRVPPGIQLSDARVTRVCVSCSVPLSALQPLSSQPPGQRGDELPPLSGCELVTVARFSADAHDPELASRHNACVLEALQHVAVAWRIEPWCLVACAERHASRWGSCEPLVRWHRHGDRLHGELLLPIDADAVLHGLAGGSSSELARRHELAAELALQAGCVGLLASLAFLRSALRTTARG